MTRELAGLLQAEYGWNGTPWMIVCSCNVITMAQIRRVVAELHAGPVPRVITPAVVYRALGHRPQCGSCLGAVADVIDQSLQGCCCGGRCKLKS